MRSTMRVCACAGLAVVLLAAGQARGQYAWFPGQGAPGVNGWVYAQTVYNGELIAAGSLTAAGDRTCSNIARWNGTTWQPLDSGIAGANGTVFALTVFNNELIAGGYFITAGGVPCRNIARWNGSAWQPVGGGLFGVDLSSVRALMVSNGVLIAGGVFTKAGNVDCSNIACWDGSAWQSLGTGTDYSVDALTVFDGELIAGGAFTTADGLPCNCIARWSGYWEPLGSGMSGVPDPMLSPDVQALTVYNGELIAGGVFLSAGGVTCNYIARWNGSAWQPLGSGMGSDNYPSPAVHALTVYNGELIAGGEFITAGGNAYD